MTSGTSTFFANLEEDLDVFRATDDENRLAALQFSTYRRMRRIQITHDSKPEYRGLEYWPDEPGTPDWARHNPYNNVLWIHYLCCFLRWGCRRPKRETTRFEKNLHPILAAVDPSNRSAQQVDSVWQLAQLAAEHNLLNLEEFTDFDNVASEQDVSAIEQVMVRRKKRVSDAAMVDSAAESAKSQEARERPMTRSRSGRGRDVTRRARHRARDVE